MFLLFYIPRYLIKLRCKLSSKHDKGPNAIKLPLRFKSQRGSGQSTNRLLIVIKLGGNRDIYVVCRGELGTSEQGSRERLVEKTRRVSRERLEEETWRGSKERLEEETRRGDSERRFRPGGIE